MEDNTIRDSSPGKEGDVLSIQKTDNEKTADSAGMPGQAPAHETAEESELVNKSGDVVLSEEDGASAGYPDGRSASDDHPGEQAAEILQAEPQEEEPWIPEASAETAGPLDSAKPSVDSAGPKTGKAAGTGSETGKPVRKPDGAGPETGKPTGSRAEAARAAGSGQRTGSAPGKQGRPQEAGEREIQNTFADVKAGEKKTTGRKESSSYKEKILRHKRRLYRRTVILVALVTILLTTGIILWMRRGYKSAELNRIATFTLEDGVRFERLGGNIVRYSSSGAVCMDRRGNTLWRVSYEMQQPITSVSGDVIAIANKSGYSVYIMNTKGVMGTIETMLPIHSISAAENGEVAVALNDTKATWIRLYTAEGDEIAYIIQTMEESGYPIAAAVSPDGETLCLSSVQMANADIKSNVSFYNFGKEGKNAADHRVDYSDFIDEVVPWLEYVDDSICAGISDKRLILFRKTLLGKSGSSSILFSENLQGIFPGDSFIGLLFNNTTEEDQYRLDIYNKRGKKAGSVSFTMQYTNIQIAGDKVYINNEQDCQIYTLGGRCLYNGSFGRPISTLVPGAGLGDLLVVTGGEIDSVRLH